MDEIRRSRRIRKYWLTLLIISPIFSLVIGSITYHHATTFVAKLPGELGQRFSSSLEEGFVSGFLAGLIGIPIMLYID